MSSEYGNDPIVLGKRSFGDVERTKKSTGKELSDAPKVQIFLFASGLPAAWIG